MTAHVRKMRAVVHQPAMDTSRKLELVDYANYLPYSNLLIHYTIDSEVDTIVQKLCKGEFVEEKSKTSLESSKRIHQSQGRLPVADLALLLMFVCHIPLMVMEVPNDILPAVLILRWQAALFLCGLPASMLRWFEQAPPGQDLCASYLWALMVMFTFGFLSCSLKALTF